MALPDKPVAIDLPKLDLDTWVAFEDLMGRPASDRRLRDIRDVLIAMLGTCEWTPREVGRLTLNEMQAILIAVNAEMSGAPKPSGSS